MTVQALALTIGASLVLPGKNPACGIDRIYAGDRMSDLLEQASPSTLLVTRLANPHLFRLAELMDVPAICLVRDAPPEAELLQAAGACGSALLVSAAGMEQTCRLLEQCLGADRAGQPA